MVIPLLCTLFPLLSLASPDYIDLYAPNTVSFLLQNNTIYRLRANFKPFSLQISTSTPSNVTFSLYEEGKTAICTEGSSDVCVEGKTGTEIEVKKCVDWVNLLIKGEGEVTVRTEFGEEVCESEGQRDMCQTRPLPSCVASDCSCGLLTCQSSRASGALPIYSQCIPANTTIEEQLKTCQSTRFSITWNFTVCPELIVREVVQKKLVLPVLSQVCLAVLGGSVIGMWGVWGVKGQKRGWWSAFTPDCLFRRG